MYSTLCVSYTYDLTETDHIGMPFGWIVLMYTVLTNLQQTSKHDHGNILQAVTLHVP